MDQSERLALIIKISRLIKYLAENITDENRDKSIKEICGYADLIGKISKASTGFLHFIEKDIKAMEKRYDSLVG